MISLKHLKASLCCQKCCVTLSVSFLNALVVGGPREQSGAQDEGDGVQGIS